MNITVFFFAGLREKTGTKEIKLHFNESPVSLLEVVKVLIQRYDQLTELLFPNIPKDEIDEYIGNEVDFHITRVKFAKNRKIIAHPTHIIHFIDGDTLAIFLPLMGG